MSATAVDGLLNWRKIRGMEMDPVAHWPALSGLQHQSLTRVCRASASIPVLPAREELGFGQLPSAPRQVAKPTSHGVLAWLPESCPTFDTTLRFNHGTENGVHGVADPSSRWYMREKHGSASAGPFNVLPRTRLQENASPTMLRRPSNGIGAERDHEPNSTSMRA